MPNRALTRRRVLAIAAGLVVALVLGSRLLAHAGTASDQTVPPPLKPSTRAASTVAAAAVVVDVVGAVRRPGLYRLPEGSRVADAVARAGGLSRKAVRSLVNLAAPVADGQQVLVASSVAGAPGAPVAAGGAAGGAPGMPATGPVHLNSATVEQLDALPGVGPVTAQKILDYRTQHGLFQSVDELDAVSGIGPAKLDSLRDLVAP
jgi:competence protein ComEA